MFFKKRRYSLRKSRSILKQVYTLFRKQKKNLSDEQAAKVESKLRALDQAVIHEDRDEADRLARDVEQLSDKHFKRSILQSFSELAFALVFAFAIAVVVRSMWFELYEIPTGSMRPTFREQDRLTVSKTAFGLNVPLRTEHFYFDPDLVQRGSTIIFSGDKLPMRDTDSYYFGVIPYTKRYVKRLIGKPGDTLYFYGGKIYGVDAEGNPLKDLIDPPWMQKLEHVPIMKFEGDITAATDTIQYLQMHQPVARFSFTPYGEVKAEINNGEEWVKEQQSSDNSSEVRSLSDLWGIGNYATARLLTKEQVKKYTEQKVEDMEEGVLYLELQHSPSLPKQPRTTGLGLQKRVSILPLKEQHLNALMDHLYTARFVVKDGRAARYSADGPRFSFSSISFPGVPDGVYEFYHGKGYQVGFGGMLTELSKDHPLMKRDPEHIQKLFNTGIELDTAFQPKSKNQADVPYRYAYFRNGDLYLLGGPVIMKGDPILQSYLEREEARGKPYRPFKDYGPPKDVAFIKEHGLKIPEKHYLVLGDNHAMSADSRVFGFVPQQNLQGAPSIILWPPGERMGTPSQKPYSLFVFPRIFVWITALIIGVIAYLMTRRKNKKSIFEKK